MHLASQGGLREEYPTFKAFDKWCKHWRKPFSIIFGVLVSSSVHRVQMYLQLFENEWNANVIKFDFFWIELPIFSWVLIVDDPKCVKVKFYAIINNPKWKKAWVLYALICILKWDQNSSELNVVLSSNGVFLVASNCDRRELSMGREVCIKLRGLLI